MADEAAIPNTRWRMSTQAKELDDDEDDRFGPSEVTSYPRSAQESSVPGTGGSGRRFRWRGPDTALCVLSVRGHGAERMNEAANNPV